MGSASVAMMRHMLLLALMAWLPATAYRETSLHAVLTPDNSSATSSSSEEREGEDAASDELALGGDASDHEARHEASHPASTTREDMDHEVDPTSDELAILAGDQASHSASTTEEHVDHKVDPTSDELAILAGDQEEDNTSNDDHAAHDLADTASRGHEHSQLPNADALRALLDGPVPEAMAKAQGAADHLMSSAKAWKKAGEEIKREFHNSVEKQVDIGGAKLEHEHHAVQVEAESPAEKVFKELARKHKATAPRSHAAAAVDGADSPGAAHTEAAHEEHHSDAAGSESDHEHAAYEEYHADASGAESESEHANDLSSEGANTTDHSIA